MWWWRTPREKKVVLLDTKQLRKPRSRVYLTQAAWKRKDEARRDADAAVLAAQKSRSREESEERSQRNAQAYAAWLAKKKKKVRKPATPEAPPNPWRSRTWREDLTLDFRSGAPRKRPDATFNVMLRWYFLRFRRYAARRKWLRKKRLEDAQRRPQSPSKRVVAAARARRRWRQPEWRRIHGVAGLLGSSVASTAVSADELRRLTRREQRREEGWVS